MAQAAAAASSESDQVVDANNVLRFCHVFNVVENFFQRSYYTETLEQD